MEILKFLIIVAIIAFAIIKQVRKAQTEQSDKRPSIPVPGDFDPINTPFPEEEMTRSPQKASKKSKKTKTTYMESVSEHSGTLDIAPTPPEPEQATDSEFAIRSTEDARRAIIWSEILNRKY